MYARKNRSGCSLLFLLVVAVAGGILFYILDNQQTLTPTPAASAVTTPTLTPQAVAASTATPVFEAQPEDETETIARTAPRLVVPRAGINQMIVTAFLDGQSWDVSTLGMNVGHLQGTSWVGEGRNVVLSGHVEMSDGRRGIFGNLDELVEGDLIIVNDQGESVQYAVVDKYSTTPDDLTPIYPTQSERLTLITCGDYDFLGDSYLERLIVVAERVS